MEDPGQRTYRLSKDAIEALCQKKGISRKALVKKTGVNRTTVSRNLEGKTKAYWSTVEAIAGVLGVPPYAILVTDGLAGPGIEPDREELRVIDGSFDDDLSKLIDLSKLTDKQRIDLLLKLIESVQPKYQVRIMEIKDGSIKFKLLMSREDAEKLQGMVARGEMAELGNLSLDAISSVDVVADLIPASAEPETRFTRLKKWLRSRWAAQIAQVSALEQKDSKDKIKLYAIFCAILGIIIPTEILLSFNIFFQCILGLIIGIISILLTYRAKSNYSLPLLAITMSIASCILWSANRPRTGDKTAIKTEDPRKEAIPHLPSAAMPSPPQFALFFCPLDGIDIGDRVQLEIDRNNCLFFVEHDASGLPAGASLPMTMTTGRHSIVLVVHKLGINHKIVLKKSFEITSNQGILKFSDENIHFAIIYMQK